MAMNVNERVDAEALLLVAIGGFAGANGRYLVSGVLDGPAGTLLVNVLGSIALGMLLYGSIFRGAFSRETRLVVGTGVLSSFTTYSTFAVESVTLGAADGLGYVFLSYGLGIAGVLVGRAIAIRVDGGVFG
jgi:CrcB protein